jgi:hypothetical protein
LLIEREITPSVMPLASIHTSIAAFTHAEIGTVRICPAFPIKSAITQCSSRTSMASIRRPSSSPPPESASDQRRQHGVVPLTSERIPIRARQEPLALLSREPVANPNPNPPHPLHSPNSGGQFRTEQAGVGRLKGNPSHRRAPKVDGRCCVLLLFEKDPVAQDYRAVEGEARLGAVPVDEVGDGAVISALATFGCKAVQDRRFGLFKVGERQDSLRRSFLSALFRHGRRPP